MVFNYRTESTILKDRKAFTLVELLVVVAVLALLASIVFSNLTGAREQAKISNALSFQSNMHNLLGADLVGWWNFDDDTGNIAKDSSGYGNNGTIVGATRVDGIPGTGGKAMSFNGSGNYITIDGENDILFEGSPFTISLWFNPLTIPSSGSYARLVTFKTDTSYPFGIGLSQGSSYNGLYFGSSGAFAPRKTDYIPEIGKYDHIVVSYAGGDVSMASNYTFFLNGNKWNTSSSSSWGSAPNESIIGAKGGTSYFFNGFIDDVRVYSRALKASEIQTLYAQTKGKYLSEKAN